MFCAALPEVISGWRALSQSSLAACREPVPRRSAESEGSGFLAVWHSHDESTLNLSLQALAEDQLRTHFSSFGPVPA